MRHFCAALLKKDESNESNKLFYSYMNVEDEHNIVMQRNNDCEIGRRVRHQGHAGTLRGQWVQLSHTYLGLFCIDGV
jgi:hypothetical protein